jgi:hypothetical protein
MKGGFSAYETQVHIHTQHMVTWGGGGGGGEMEVGIEDDDDYDEISNIHIFVNGTNSFVYLSSTFLLYAARWDQFMWAT